jgi:hypothetical protein
MRRDIRGAIVVLLGLLLLDTPLCAADPEDRPTMIFGFDDMSCGVWNKSMHNDVHREQYLQWFRGFVSGYGFGSTKYMIPNGAMPNSETLVLYIDKYCRENPLNIFTGAATQLVKDIRVVGQFPNN